ncbi:hypothetical protein R3X27_12390 [Tropicimonas sp. TH_r6]|uniref:hypothetical protein n=1 Tax=Tropicimonas sp. TH_r6 TaxID=3082085 RepID=UPI0029549EFA|nr:hypothetical protein [Tropicimonas sp. TH_r6]MDV7143479.1 hypothetical protein [Tropicimonas sp. TH_r6]
MHLDLFHAIVTVALIFLTTWALDKTGFVTREERRKGFSWKYAGALALVIFVFNLIWP